MIVLDSIPYTTPIKTEIVLTLKDLQSKNVFLGKDVKFDNIDTEIYAVKKFKFNSSKKNEIEKQIKSYKLEKATGLSIENIREILEKNKKQ